MNEPNRTKIDAVGGVLCAGFGTRMAPITEAIAKPLIPFLNTPLLAYALDHLQSMGITDVGLNLHHLAETIPPVADKLCAAMGLKPKYAREGEILGTAGGARGIYESLGSPEKTLVLMNGDSIMNIDLAAHYRAHKASGALATLVVRPRATNQPGKVWVNNHRLMGLRDYRHPEADPELEEYDFTGVYFLEPELLRDIPLEEGCMIGDILGPRLAEGQHFQISVNEDFWAALDNPGLYFQTMREILKEPSIFMQAPLPESLGGSIYVFNPNTMAKKAQLAGPLLTGVHVNVQAGARLGPYAVLDGVDVASGTTIREAVLYGMGTVEGEWHRCLAIAGQIVAFPDD